MTQGRGKEGKGGKQDMKCWEKATFLDWVVKKDSWGGGFWLNS